VVANFGAAGSVGRLAIDRSVVSNNYLGLQVATLAADTTATLAVSRSTLSRNSFAAIDVLTAPSSLMTAALTDNNQIVDNGIGIHIGDGMPAGTVSTRSNNTARYNTTDVVGGSLTPLAGQ
jgi:hypothetical protein